MAENFSA